MTTRQTVSTWKGHGSGPPVRQDDADDGRVRVQDGAVRVIDGLAARFRLERECNIHETSDMDHTSAYDTSTTCTMESSSIKSKMMAQQNCDTWMASVTKVAFLYEQKHWDVSWIMEMKRGICFYCEGEAAFDLYDSYKTVILGWHLLLKLLTFTNKSIGMSHG
eukprot:scaffold41755_cov46-Cyclotella_meneghiniana.AAC.3